MATVYYSYWYLRDRFIVDFHHEILLVIEDFVKEKDEAVKRANHARFPRVRVCKMHKDLNT